MRWIWLAILTAVPLAAQVKLTAGSDRVVVEVNGRPFTEFFMGAETTKPYLHPLRTATGKVITRAFPMDLVEGEDRDHPHHRGAWMSLGDINGTDFWANETSQTIPNKGKVVLRRITELKSGKKSGTMTATFDWLDQQGKTLLNEVRTYTFYAQQEPVRMFDFDSRFTAVSPVKFGDTKEGFFAIRLGTTMSETHGGKMRNAEGKEGMKQVWGKRSPWVDYTGTVDGEAVGIAIFDHPTNPKHPTYWHARDYGLFAANPFGVHDFLNDKSQDGSISLVPGQLLRFRYRVLIHPAEMAGELPALFTKYSAMK